MGESSVIDNLHDMKRMLDDAKNSAECPSRQYFEVEGRKKNRLLSSALMNTGVSPCPSLLPFFALLNHHLRAITSSYTTGTWEMCFEFQNPLPVTVYSNRDRNFQWPCVTVYHCPNESSRSWFWK